MGIGFEGESHLSAIGLSICFARILSPDNTAQDKPLSPSENGLSIYFVIQNSVPRHPQCVLPLFFSTQLGSTRVKQEERLTHNLEWTSLCWDISIPKRGK